MGSRGNFFAVDRRVWHALCGFGRINLAVAYLVVARGSGRDQRTSSWSTNSVEKYTRIPRFAAKAAIEELVNLGFIERHKGGKRPRYFVRPAEAILVSPQRRERRLKPAQAKLLEAALAHPDGIYLPRKGRPDPNWPEGVSWGNAQALIMDGLVRQILPTGIAPVEQDAAERGRDWIWLPNTIVDGAAGELPPVERIREAHSLTALRLYVDLYYEHHLSETCGVSWRKIRMAYSCEYRGQYGAHKLYGFMPKTLVVFPNNEFYQKYARDAGAGDGEWLDDDEDDPSEDVPDPSELGRIAFYADLGILTDTGLVEFVPHLVTADSSDGAVIHPLARKGEGEPIEQEIGAAAEAAALRMLTAVGQRGPWNPKARFAAMEGHIQHLALVGVLRMRHRPHTASTAGWIEGGWGGSRWLERYSQLGNTAADKGLDAI